MPLRTGARTPCRPSLDLPPPFRLITLREGRDTFEHAKAIAAEQGAGALTHVGRYDLAEFALILEPEEPLHRARLAHYAGMCALGDALAALAPPGKPISFEWPDAICVDGGLVGGARLAWPPDADEGEPPAWLVFGAVIRTVAIEAEPGLHPLVTALAEEGFGEFDSGRLVEGFARHFMVAIDAWKEHGFDAIVRGYLPRLTPEPGVSREIDEAGDLLVRRAAAKTIERHALTPTLAAPLWLEAMNRGLSG
jgi:biotin-(acetyl-CoA carboxylase) ligase